MNLCVRNPCPLPLTVYLLVLLAPAAWAQPAPNPPAGKPAPGKELVAVLDLEAVGSSAIEASAMSDRLRDELLKSGRMILVDRQEMNSVLKEQALQQTGCTSTECAVQVGKVLGVRRLVTGRITKIDARHWLLAASIIDVETAQVLRSETLPFEGEYFALLTAGIGRLGTALTGVPLSGAAGKQSGAAPNAGKHVASRQEFLAWVEQVKARKFADSDFSPWMDRETLQSYSNQHAKSGTPVAIQLNRQGNAYVHRLAFVALPFAGKKLKWRWRTMLSDEPFNTIDATLRGDGFILVSHDTIGGGLSHRYHDAVWVKFPEGKSTANDG
ncbi:MAG TPA: CsgG/HfaB family protein [bacterium]|nr:CsgG/HfaB family protein [bacterium]